MASRLAFLLAGLSAAAALAGGTAAAAIIQPTGITVTVPLGAAAPDGSTYTDDVLLETLSFGPTFSFSGAASFSAVSRFEVISGRGEINAEWGDDDTDADGDANPFVKAGLDPADQETTDPATQDAALLNAFNSRSLSEMSDGESGEAFQFKLLFENGLSDNDPDALDGTPEILLVERGLNDEFSVEAIVGGTFEAPVYSSPFTVDSGDFWQSGLFVDTTEIDSGQQLGFGGIDLNDLGLGLGAIVYGLRITVAEGEGPDLNGLFLAADDPTRFVPPLGATPVPLPPSIAFALAAFGGLGFIARRRRAA